MIHPDDAEYVWEQVQQALQEQTTFDLEYRLTQANGQQITVCDKGRGLYSESGMILGVEGIIFQIDSL
jgi:PAS domain-containing protein